MAFIIMLVISLTLVAILYYNIVWSNMLRRKLDAEKTKNAELRNKIEEVVSELTRAKARAESIDCHSVRMREDKIDELRERLKEEQHRCAKLETMLMQKWRESVNVDI